MRKIKFRAYINNNVHGTGMFKVVKTDGNIITLRIPNKEDLKSSQDVPFFKQEYKIMQYTGINDDTGKEIYEGDIVSVVSTCPGGNDLIGTVEFLECGWWIRCKGHAVSLFTETDSLMIVGNRYEL